jgi:hypothetical protein
MSLGYIRIWSPEAIISTKEIYFHNLISLRQKCLSNNGIDFMALQHKRGFFAQTLVCIELVVQFEV